MIDFFSLATRAGHGTWHVAPDGELWDEMIARGAHVSPAPTGSIIRPRIDPPKCEEMATLTVGNVLIVTTRVRSMTRQELLDHAARKAREAEQLAIDAAVHGAVDPWRETAMKDKAEGLT